MCDYAKWGYAFDMEENEDRIRCVAAPVRDATGKIKAAISVSSAAQYMDDKRMQGWQNKSARPQRLSAMSWVGTAL